MNTIDLAVPADPIYVGLIRSAAAHIAAHADLTIDAIDDLRLAVDEAFAVLNIPQLFSQLVVVYC